MSVAVLIGALAGLGWGFVADRVAARWPAHDDGSSRAVDWRTAAVVGVGAVAVALLAARFGDAGGGPTDAATLGPRILMIVIVPALVVLFATDLDQRLLPDALTLPIGPIAILAFVLGVNPYVSQPGQLAIAAAAAILLPLGMFAVSLPFGRGAIGMGDLKLLFGVGLLAGASRLLAALVVGALAAAVVIVILVVARRITLRSYVPYGPFLILGVLWALLVLPVDSAL
ncbi:MAG TPA: A24 family peptidase [Candidatus Binatus sp.]|nr:A24 family peptidase [Candidatus Binatus sp.]